MASFGPVFGEEKIALSKTGSSETRGPVRRPVRGDHPFCSNFVKTKILSASGGKKGANGALNFSLFLSFVSRQKKEKETFFRLIVSDLRKGKKYI